MIKVESGIVVPLADPCPNLAPSIPEEAKSWDEDSSAANWVNHTIGLGDDLDFESLLNALATGSKPRVAETDGAPRKSAAEPALLSPASPDSSDSSCNQPANPLPRHKRASHKRAELKRRDKIKTRLDDLKEQVPSIADKGKLSETTILSKAAEYTKHLKAECERFTTEAGNLRQEIESLSTEIHTFQERLPAAGLKADTAEEHRDSLDECYKKYVATSTKNNWKFYLFGYFMKPLFKSFKKDVSKESPDSFISSVSEWTADTLGLSNLRRQTLEKMRDVSKETDILTNPENLPKQAMASVQEVFPAAEPSTLPSSQPSLSCSPPKPATSKPTSVAQSLNKPVNNPTRGAKHQSPQAQNLKLTINSPQNILPPAGGDTAVLSGSLKPASKRDDTRVTSRKYSTRKRSSSNMPDKDISISPPKYFTSVATKPTLCERPTASQSSVPSAKTLASLLEKSAITTCREQAMSVFTPTSASFDQGLDSLSTIPTPLPAVSLPSVMTNIFQLAVSVEQTSLSTSRPSPVKTSSSLSIPSTSTGSVVSNFAQIITDTDCHEYDFDITDIPLPELPELGLVSPQPSTISSPFSTTGLVTSIEVFPQSVTCVRNPLLSNPAPGILTSSQQPSSSICFSSSLGNWS